MRYESPQVKAPPLSRRRMMPPTPLISTYSSLTVIARTKRYLEVSQNMKVEIEELESLLGPDDSDVDFR